MAPRKFRAKAAPMASPFGVSVTVEVTRRHVWTTPSNTCSFSFNDETMPGNPLVNSDTRGTINRITRTMIRVTAGDQQHRGERARNAQRLELSGRRPQHDSDDERRHDRQHDLARDIEDKADRDGRKDRQRPRRNLPKRIAGVAHRESLLPPMLRTPVLRHRSFPQHRRDASRVHGNAAPPQNVPMVRASRIDQPYS